MKVSKNRTRFSIVKVVYIAIFAWNKENGNYMEKIIIDKNAHIKDIKSSVIQEEEQLCIKLSFTNISGKDISAVKFNVVGYNIFGDVVSVNGKESFMLVIQDILIKNSQKVNNLKAYIPLSDIRTMNIKENQICYSDGSITSYEGEDIIEIKMEKIEKTKVVSVHTMFDNRMEYYPLHLDSEEWICGCGKWNNKTEKCSHCGNQKENIFQKLSSDGIELLVDKKKEYDLELQERSRKEQEDKERTFKKKVIGIVCVLVVAVIAAIPISYQIELSKRTVFDSEKEMKESVQGTYTHYSDITGDADIQIIIDGDKVTRSYTWDNIKDLEIEITELNPSEGEFSASGLDIVVTKDGDLLEGGDLYKKGGYMSKKSL